MTTTLEELKKLVESVTAAQSMLLASVVRPLLASNLLSESEMLGSLAATEQAALARRTPETPYLLGLIEVLRRDLKLPEGSHPDA